MLITLIIICILLFVEVLFTVMLLTLTITNKSKAPTNNVEPTNNSYGMSEEELNDFKETDADIVKEFKEAMSELNAFMTGNEENVDVEQQEL